MKTYFATFGHLDPLIHSLLWVRSEHILRLGGEVFGKPPTLTDIRLVLYEVGDKLYLPRKPR